VEIPEQSQFCIANQRSEFLRSSVADIARLILSLLTKIAA
jgi:hypothetical protein